jgi:hypothetical protein
VTVATGKSERELGDLWAELHRSVGNWVQKLPSSDLSGVPDWVVVQKELGTCFMEAKKLQPKGAAFLVKQCTRAQRFFLEAVARHGGEAYILILGPDSFLEVRVVDKVKPVPRRHFDRFSVPYCQKG